jgi:toxin-associated regulator BotR
LKDLVLKFKLDNKYFIDIIKYLEHNIKSYSFSLNYYCAETDLIIFLYDILTKINISKFSSNDYIEHYIKRCLKREFIRLKNRSYADYKISFDSDLLDINLNNIKDNYQDLTFFNFSDLINILSPVDKKIIKLRYYNSLSDSEISALLNISRQAVHKRRTEALKKLKTYLEEVV